jgi:transglutaminase-like putative cysteine protease
LRKLIHDPQAPITTKAAIQLEIIRRTRLEFPYSAVDVLAQVRQSIPDATLDDIRRWQASGALQSRVIDGEPRFFNRSVSNLFRFDEDARRRRTDIAASKPAFDLPQHLEELLEQVERTGATEVFPVKHTIRYSIAVKSDHPRLKPGAKVSAWLPYPQDYRQQRNVRLIRSDPVEVQIAENGVPHRSLYFTRILGNPPQPPRFEAEFEFVTAAYCPRLEASQVQPYDTDSELYRRYTAQRAPHIMLTPQVRELAREIVGSEVNPLEKARLIFRWISQNVPWCAEQEYSIIPNLSEKGLTARKGDCGVQGLVFVTLCRAAGVPARWQSGFQLRPGNWNMHDWSEFYVEPWGWLPADASYGMQDHSDPRVRDFFCGQMDPYRFIVNLDFGRPLVPPKMSFRSEPNDFQRGEVEIDGHNLYFDEWEWTFHVDSHPVEQGDDEPLAR